MFCSKCGKKNEDNARFCEACGEPMEVLEEENLQEEYCQEKQYQGKQYQKEGYQEAFQHDYNYRKKSPGSGKKIAIVAVCFLLGVSLGVGVFYLVTQRVSDEKTAASFPDISMEQVEQEIESSSATQNADAETKTASVEESPISADKKMTPEPTATPTATPTPEAEHRYEFFGDDCTWEQAFTKCIEKGGYLVRIETSEEYDKIIEQISSVGMSDYKFYIGGRRDTDGKTYCWANDQNQLEGDPINNSASPLFSKWMAGEPSFADGSIMENVMNLCYYKKESRWVINDIPNDVLSVMKSYSGRVGYICEYEE